MLILKLLQVPRPLDNPLLWGNYDVVRCGAAALPCSALCCSGMCTSGASTSKCSISSSTPACRPTPAPGTANRVVNVRDLVLHNELRSCAYLQLTNRSSSRCMQLLAAGSETALEDPFLQHGGCAKLSSGLT